MHCRELSEWNDDKLSSSAGARLYETEDGLNEDKTVRLKKSGKTKMESNQEQKQI